VHVHPDAPNSEIAVLAGAVRVAAAVDPPDLYEVALRAHRRDLALRGWIRLPYATGNAWHRSSPSRERDVWAARDLIRALAVIGDVERAMHLTCWRR
jgi:hypothetical protein